VLVRATELIVEGARAAWAQKVAATLVAVLAAAMCVTTLLTVGRADAAAQQVQQHIEDAGSRRLVITDSRSGGFLSPSIVRSAASLDTVERAVGVSVTFDVRSAAAGDGADPVPARSIVGDLQSVAELESGRWPGPGEAVAARTVLDRLGFDGPVGTVKIDAVRTVPIVGEVRARAPFGNLVDGVIVAALPGQQSMSLDIVVTSSAASKTTETVVLRILDRSDPRDLDIASPATLADVQQSVVGDLGRFGRRLMLLVLGAGALLVAAVTLADVLLHSKDSGRRRALGATRGVLVGVTVARATYAAVVGALLGAATAAAALRAAALPVDVHFLLATALLAVLTTAISAIPPALLASLRDPVRVLRTP
jgi:putative ABC transport system permease protein